MRCLAGPGRRRALRGSLSPTASFQRRKRLQTRRRRVFRRVPEPCKSECPHTALSLCRGRPIEKLKIIKGNKGTYDKLGESEIADLEIAVFIEQQVGRL